MNQLQQQFLALALAFLAMLKKFSHRYSAGTIKKHEFNLLGSSLPLIDIYASLPITKPEEMELDHHLYVNKQISSHDGWGISTQSSNNYTAKSFIKYLMNKGVIPHDESVLLVYYQKRAPYRIPRSTTPEQDTVIQTGVRSNNPFIQLRELTSNVVMSHANAARAQIELFQQRRSDVIDNGPDGITIIITGKRKERRPIKISALDVGIVRAYTSARDAIISNYELDEDAFFIQEKPRWNKKLKKYQIVLSTHGHSSMFVRFRAKNPIIRNVEYYDLRRNRISHQALIAAICQVPLDEVAIRCGNSLKILQRHYNSSIDLFSELFRRTPDELIPFLKKLIFRELIGFQKDRTQIERFACAKIFYHLLGRCRMFNSFLELQVEANSSSDMHFQPDNTNSLPLADQQLMDFLRYLGLEGLDLLPIAS